MKKIHDVIMEMESFMPGHGDFWKQYAPKAYKYAECYQREPVRDNIRMQQTMAQVKFRAEMEARGRA